ncbi:hypothetical protein [Streptomyces sp. NPDC001889]
MRVFLAGLFLGGLSGSVTYGLSADPATAVAVGAIVAVLAWLGVVAVIFVSD